MTRSSPNPMRVSWGRRRGCGRIRTARSFLGCRWSFWSGRTARCAFLSPSACGVKGGASKYDLALELLSYARNRLRCKPAFVLFDSWYPSKQLLKRIRDYGWYFVCQLKKTRVFEGRALRYY